MDTSPHLSNYIRFLSLNLKERRSRLPGISCASVLGHFFDVEKGRFKKLRHLKLSTTSLTTQPAILPQLLKDLTSLEQLSLDLITVSDLGQLLIIPSNEDSRLHSLELGHVMFESTFASYTRFDTPAGQTMFAEVDRLLSASPARRYHLHTLRLTGSVAHLLLQLLLFHPKACFSLDCVKRLRFQFNPLILRFVREMPLMASLTTPSRLAFLSFNCDVNVSKSLETSLRHLVYNECVPPGLPILILSHIIPARLLHLERIIFFVSMSSDIRLPLRELNADLIARLIDALPSLKKIYLFLVVQGYRARSEIDKVPQAELREQAVALLPPEKATSGLVFINVLDREDLYESRLAAAE